MGFATTFRFGYPFFLEPNVDEILWRTHVKDNFSVDYGQPHFKFGGDWLHTLNDQVFRGFFTGRYIFDSVTGFLRYASPAAPGGFGPNTVGCSNGTFVTAPATLSRRRDHWWSAAALFAGRRFDWSSHRRSGCFKYQERRHLAVRAGLLENLAQLHAQLWSALGSTNFPRPGRGAEPNRLRNLPERSAFSVRRHVAQSNEGVSTATRVCVGHFEERQVSVARERRSFLRAAEHALAGRFDHDQWRATADDLSEHADHLVRACRDRFGPTSSRRRQRSLPASSAQSVIRSLASAACACSVAITRIRASTP